MTFGAEKTLSIRDLFADLTDVTLVDEDSKSLPTNNANRTMQDNVAMQVIPTNNAKRTIQDNVAMQVTKSGDQV